MVRPEVFIEHRHGERHRKHLRVAPGDGGTFLIGSSKEADLRLSGEDVSGCHAMLRYRSPHWYICDLSGTGGTRVGSEPIVERRIDGALEIELGKHRLKLFTKDRAETLFNAAHGVEGGDRGLHQVVVRVKGRVVDTRILKNNEPYRFRVGLERKQLPAPTSGEWTSTEFGNRVVMQRLVATQALAEAERLQVDPAIKKPFSIAATVVALLMMTMILWPKPQPQKAEDAGLAKKQIDMIFNAKTIKKKRAEVQKMAKAKPRAGGTNETAGAQKSNMAMPEESQGPKANTKASKALTSLRQSGLSALVGRIAKRANKSGVMVASSGVAADTQGAGRAIYSLGTTTTGGGGAPSKEGATFRLGGIGTKGKGGGAGDFRGGTALAGGSVGAGDVAVVDEETVVDGGLDRDVIAEVIKRNIGQIRYCYERQLSSNPELYGKVMVKFNIGPAGDVGDPRIDSSTMKNAMVEGCILRRLAGWRFPQPKGGTTVKVSYPFLFKALD